jgi:hypothetical protein|tara:strand:- start:150 stop:599 length:450 start_codon:yes stop_codon:yes gene_type:complete
MNETTVKKTPAQPVSLKSLMTPSKTVEFEYPGCDDFNVSLCYLAREELMKLRNRCTRQVFNKKTRSYEEQMDDDKFLEEYTKAVIKGWTGFKLGFAKNMLLLGELTPEQEESELDFTQENVEVLMKNSPDFDTWVTEMVGDLENFTNSK